MESKNHITPVLNDRQEQWRLWKALGQDEVLNEEIHGVEKNHPGWKIEIVDKKNLRSENRHAIVLPSPSESQGDDRFVVAQINESEITSAISLSSPLIALLVAVFLLFILILLLSARYIYKNVHAPLSHFLKLFAGGPVAKSIMSRNVPATGEIRQFLEDLDRLQEEAQRSYADAQKVAIARQVAHDIQSPIAALEILIHHSESLPEELREIARSALTRIKGIAKDLLQKQEPSDLPRTQNLIPSIIEIIEEKRLSLTALKQIEIDFDYSCSSPAYVTIEGFKRVLSNLLNNSIEAIQDQGRISISLVENDEHSVKLCIADNGCGMDASILEMIGRPGKSFGKSDRPQQGGFGIAHARQTIESWNGQLSIKSYPGTGTTIEIVIRKSAPSARLA
jgi:signal transduction histidine kinase